ncbi:pilus assembly protein TadG-related protein [Anaerosoma tenue]|uniref:pilus assembly protein TadG-related protein n=1 Tax=Anaerosoma tenue TaxID=2933588 RepID=UPI00226090C5|nr:pilus assembly protein TadG-related protein [Anaerosoma tenue]MCK8114733.1 pilus assembly protein TadG-related protein [Anaerosoma tenue]
MSRRWFSDDSGAVAVTFAIVLLVIVAFAALAVDVGFWYTAKRQLQSAADAAALAGCRELSEAAGTVAIEQAVSSFADGNFTTPLDASPVSRVAETEIGADYVKVTCETDAPVFLSHFILNRGTTLIRAQSVAKVGFLAGAKSPVPFGLTILRIGELTGSIGGGPWLEFSEGADGYWTRTFSSVSPGPLDLRATNAQGFTEEFPAIVTVGALDPAGRIIAMDVDSTTLTEGDPSVRVTVRLSEPLEPGETLTAQAGAASVQLVLQLSGAYEANVPVAYPAKLHPAEHQDLTVQLGGKKGETAACTLLLRPSSYIFEDVQAHPAAVRPGESVAVSVKTLDFEYNVQYELKVEGGESITPGSFGALAFGTLDHSDCGYPDTPLPPFGPGADAYGDCIVGDIEFAVHINDMVDVEPGDMAQKTSKGIADRLAGVDMLTLAEWEAADRPNTKQVMIVPVVERMQDVLGRKPVRIVGFATFLIEEPLPGHKDPVVGRFVEWTAPGWLVTDDPPAGGLVIEAVHLTSEHLEF